MNNGEIRTASVYFAYSEWSNFAAPALLSSAETKGVDQTGITKQITTASISLSLVTEAGFDVVLELLETLIRFLQGAISAPPKGGPKSHRLRAKLTNSPIVWGRWQRRQDITEHER